MRGRYLQALKVRSTICNDLGLYSCAPRGQALTEKPAQPKVVDLNQVPHVVKLDEHMCQEPRVAGGKGSSLAVMKQCSPTQRDEAGVPNGFCITVQAFEKVILHNPDLAKGLKNLEASCGSPDKLKGLCSE